MSAPRLTDPSKPPSSERRPPALRAVPRPDDLAAVRAELVRRGVERLIAQSLEVEAELHTARHRDERDPEGKRLVVRNGYLPVREIRCGAGVIRVRQPRIHDGRRDAHGRRIRHASQILPAYARHADCIGRPSEAALFGGIYRGDLSDALTEILNGIVGELPPSFLPRLREQWDSDRERLLRRTFDGRDFAAFWADEIPATTTEGVAPQAALLLSAAGSEGLDLIDVRPGPLDSRSTWLAVLDDLARRGLRIDRARVRGYASEAFLGAVADLEERRGR